MRNVAGDRSGVDETVRQLAGQYEMWLLSGDGPREAQRWRPLFGRHLQFRLSPEAKLAEVRKRQASGARVLMVGDGLNDAGALKQSDVGIAVSDNVNNFSPACDVIMKGDSLGYLDTLLAYCKKNRQIINLSFVISIIYNLIGLYFAVRGELRPVIAAILMPISSVSIVLFTTGMSSVFAMKLKNTALRSQKHSKTDKDHNLD